MFSLKKAALAAALFAVTAAPAFAAPRPVYWYGPPGPCASYRYDHGTPWRNCGYPTWYQPVLLEGRWRHGPFYYHYHLGQRWFWWRGAWHRDGWHGGSVYGPPGPRR
jgi:hypothetical protein